MMNEKKLKCVDKPSKNLVFGYTKETYHGLPIAIIHIILLYYYNKNDRDIQNEITDILLTVFDGITSIKDTICCYLCFTKWDCCGQTAWFGEFYKVSCSSCDIRGINEENPNQTGYACSACIAWKCSHDHCHHATCIYCYENDDNIPRHPLECDVCNTQFCGYVSCGDIYVCGDCEEIFGCSYCTKNDQLNKCKQCEEYFCDKCMIAKCVHCSKKYNVCNDCIYDIDEDDILVLDDHVIICEICFSNNKYGVCSLCDRLYYQENMINDNIDSSCNELVCLDCDAFHCIHNYKLDQFQ
eukprot:339882_1